MQSDGARQGGAGADALGTRPEQRKLDIIVGDFVKTDLPYFDVCISNTPYQVRRAAQRGCWS